MRRHWKMIVIVAVVGVLALAAAAVALGAGPAKWRPGGGGGACGTLMSNPKALRAMQDLRVEHQKDVQAWSDKYGADPGGAEAQSALRALRQAHWNDMRDLFKRFGIAVPSGGTRGAGACGGACGGTAGSSSGTTSGYGGGMMGGSTY